jgi:voltage-gated potassium channel
MFLEGWSLMDSLFMTVITLTTVGFGLVHPLGNTGQLFTIVLIFVGGGYFIYVVSTIVQFIVEGRVRAILGRRKLDKQISQLKDHYIICGYGRIGRVLCHQLIMNKHRNIIVIEQNPSLVEILDEDKMLYLNDNASSEHCLIKAGIERAKCLVADRKSVV